MKKYLLILFLLAVIIPSVASATWWNPISWGFFQSLFHRNDPQTQALENRIKELESKLGTTTPAETKSFTQQSSPLPETKITTTVLPKTVTTAPVVKTVTTKTAQPAVDYEALYKDINDKYFTMRKKVESEIYVVDDSLSSSSNVPKNYLDFLKSLRTTLNADDLALTKIWNITPKPASTVNFYVSKYAQILNDYNIQRKTYDNYLSDLAYEKLARERMAIEEQSLIKNDYVERIKVEIAEMNQMKVQIGSSIGIDQSFIYKLNDAKKLNGDPLFQTFEYNCGFSVVQFTYPYWYQKYENNACRGEINSKLESIINIYIAFLRVELAKNQ